MEQGKNYENREMMMEGNLSLHISTRKARPLARDSVLITKKDKTGNNLCKNLVFRRIG